MNITIFVMLCALGLMSAQAALAVQLPEPEQTTAAVAAPPTAVPAGSPPVAPAAAVIPADYTIGTDDVLTIVFWRQKDLSADAVVRPDGKITLPLLNDIAAGGLTPDELRKKLVEEARPFIEEPTATVIVKQINSRKVFITGNIQKPGSYSLAPSMTVVQLIALAGGLQEFTKGKKIVIVRTEGGRQTSYPFDYEGVARRRNLRQNIELKPGDTILVP